LPCAVAEADPGPEKIAAAISASPQNTTFGISKFICSSAYVLPTAHHFKLKPLQRHHDFIVGQPIWHSQLDTTRIAERSSFIATRYRNPIICFW
jgi:hypothetical protein